MATHLLLRAIDGLDAASLERVAHVVRTANKHSETAGWTHRHVNKLTLRRLRSTSPRRCESCMSDTLLRGTTNNVCRARKRTGTRASGCTSGTQPRCSGAPAAKRAVNTRAATK